MENKQINILGTTYDIEFQERKRDSSATVNIDGTCDYTSKKIIIYNMDDYDYDNVKIYINNVIRHEIAHAFLNESGLTAYSFDETLVEWIAIQVPKIIKLYNELEIID